MPMTREDVLSWRGQTMVDNDGDKIGTIDEIYLDAETNEPEWAVVSTGVSGKKQCSAPRGDPSAGGDGPRVPCEKPPERAAPRIDRGGRLPGGEGRDLYRHYGRDYAEFSGPG